jgi:hypothetical protein
MQEAFTQDCFIDATRAAIINVADVCLVLSTPFLFDIKAIYGSEVSCLWCVT